jgi:N-acetylglucosamine kinase-like BadF-type ATPase
VDAEGLGANVATLEPRVIDERLTGLLHGLGDVRPEACCAGAAGAEVASGRERLEHLLQRLFPDCRLAVVHDTRLVLAAAGLEEGIALVAGTGSVAYGRRRDGREAQRGGWGWMLGDEGSGVWITREAAREVMARSDSHRPGGALAESLLAACSASDAHALTAALHAMREPKAWAAAASAVFATVDADPGSRDIVDRSAAALGRLVTDVAEELDLEGPVVLAGGLLQHQPALEWALRERLEWKLVALDAPPVAGAIHLAKALLG